MPYIEPEVILKAKEMDLLTYLQNYEPDELVYFGEGTYTTRTHDSLKISNGKWCWFSHGIGGKSALDYLIKVKGFSFMEVVEKIMGQTAVKPPVFEPEKSELKPKTLLLPKANINNIRVIDYLQSRGIDEEIIDFCIRTGRLFESYPHHNAVFIGRDKSLRPRYANLRGIGTDFKGDANGSDKHYSFSISAEGESDILHLFESAIDLLSYATLMKMKGKNWQGEHLLSLAGVYQPQKDIRKSKVPKALENYLNDHPVKRVVFHLDNDKAGCMATQAISLALPDRYEKVNAPPPKGKDYNDYLCICLGISINQKLEKGDLKNER